MVDPIEALLMYIYMVKWDKIVDPKCALLTHITILWDTTPILDMYGKMGGMVDPIYIYIYYRSYC